MDGSSDLQRYWKFIRTHPLESIILFGIVLRLPVIFLTQVHGDEGMYMYDAQLIIKGYTPFAEYHTRAPVFIYSLAFVMYLFGETILVARSFVLLVFVAATICIHRIGVELHSRRVGNISAAVFSFSPFAIKWGSVVETEILLVLIGSAAALFLVRGARIGLVKWMAKPSLTYLFLSGCLVGIGVFARRTGIILFPVFLLYLFVFWYGRTPLRGTWVTFIKERRSLFLSFICGFTITLCLFFLMIVVLTSPDYLVETFLSSAGIGGDNVNRIPVLIKLVEHAWYLIFPLHLMFSRTTRRYLPRMVVEILDLVIFFMLAWILSIYSQLSYLVLIPLFAYFLFSTPGPDGEGLPALDRSRMRLTHPEEHLIRVIGTILLVLLISTSYAETTFLGFINLLVVMAYVVFIYLSIKDQTNDHVQEPRVNTIIWAAIFGYTAVILLSDPILKKMAFSFIGLLSIYLFMQWKGVLDRDRSPVGTGHADNAVVLPLIWFLAVAWFYLTYNMLGEIYLYELMPPASLMVGLFMAEHCDTAQVRETLTVPGTGRKTRIRDQIIPIMTIGVVIMSGILSAGVYYGQEIGNRNYGRISGFHHIPGPATISDAARYISERTQDDEEILTANMAIAVEARRDIVFHLSHPSIYSTVYESGFASLDTIGYPTLRQIMDHMNRTRTRYVVNDLFFQQYYMRSNPIFRDYIRSHYHLEKRIDNVEILARSNLGGINRVSMAGDSAGNPVLVASPSRDIRFAVWEQNVLGIPRIMYGPLSVSPREYHSGIISGGFGIGSFRPAAVIDPEDRLHIVWEERYSTFTNIVYASVEFLSPWEACITEQVIYGSGPEMHGMYPRIVRGSDGTFHILWVLQEHAQSSIMYSKMDPAGVVLLEPTALRTTIEPIRNPGMSWSDGGGRDNGSSEAGRIHIIAEIGLPGIERIVYGEIPGSEQNASLLERTPFTPLSTSVRSAHPVIRSNGNGIVHMAWKEISTGGVPYLRYLRNSAGSMESLTFSAHGDILTTAPDWPPADDRTDSWHQNILGGPGMAVAGDSAILAWSGSDNTRSGSLGICIITDHHRDGSGPGLTLMTVEIGIAVDYLDLEYYSFATPDVVVGAGTVHLAFTGHIGGSADVFLSSFSL